MSTSRMLRKVMSSGGDILNKVMPYDQTMLNILFYISAASTTIDSIVLYYNYKNAQENPEIIADLFAHGLVVAQPLLDKVQKILPEKIPNWIPDNKITTGLVNSARFAQILFRGVIQQNSTFSFVENAIDLGVHGAITVSNLLSSENKPETPKLR